MPFHENENASLLQLGDDSVTTHTDVARRQLRYDSDPSSNISAAMSGLDPQTPTPTEITLHKKACLLEVAFDDGSHFQLPAEFLRVYSPSAEVRGHGPGQEKLQTGKRQVAITALDPVGNYGVQPTFSDGHNTGIYSWDVLHYLGANYDSLWAEYLAQLETVGASRDIDSTTPPPKSGCGSH